MHVDSFSHGPESKVQTLDIVPGGNGTRYVVLRGTGHSGLFSCVVPRVPIRYRNRLSFTQRGLFNI
jgi:hypothetical protein